MSDLVERLRDIQVDGKRGPGGRLSVDAALARDAANEIDRLRAALRNVIANMEGSSPEPLLRAQVVAYVRNVLSE